MGRLRDGGRGLSHNFLLAELALPAALALDTETVFAAAMAVTVGLARDPGLDGLTAVHPIPSVVTDALATLAPSVLAAVAWARHRVRTVHTSETLLSEAKGRVVQGYRKGGVAGEASLTSQRQMRAVPPKSLHSPRP